MTAGRESFPDLYVKSFYMLGKIAEAQKDKRRAIEKYGKFLDLWKDADPGRPEVEDAKARLAVLANKSLSSDPRLQVLRGGGSHPGSDLWILNGVPLLGRRKETP